MPRSIRTKDINAKKEERNSDLSFKKEEGRNKNEEEETSFEGCAIGSKDSRTKRNLKSVLVSLGSGPSV